MTTRITHTRLAHDRRRLARLLWLRQVTEAADALRALAGLRLEARLRRAAGSEAAEISRIGNPS